MADESGYETNNSATVIKATLSHIKKTRIFVALLQKDYQSGNTIIISFDSNHLIIDKPRDWPNHLTWIRVVFKDDFKLWHHFTVKIVKASEDTLKTTFPTELFRLQRRAHFRIPVPTKSKASFTLSDTPYDDEALVDISVGGMKIFLENQDHLLKEKTGISINNIEIKFSQNQDEDKEKNLPLTIRKGEVVRETFNKELNFLEIGVQFSPAIPEEKSLLQYVRQRELEILRKGIKEV